MPNPNVSGKFNVSYSRAKSSNITTGVGRFNARTGKWTKIVNSRTNKEISATYDRRDDVVRTPRVVAWAPL